jgi:hypothetical protein
MSSKGLQALRATIVRAAKIPKASVEYERPAAKRNHCGMCRHFRRPESCELVIGTIYPEDWCKLFARK